jgi:hypothetical protein
MDPIILCDAHDVERDLSRLDGRLAEVIGTAEKALCVLTVLPN